MDLDYTIIPDPETDSQETEKETTIPYAPIPHSSVASTELEQKEKVKNFS